KNNSENNISHYNYKFDDSAVRAGREKVGVRVVGEKVDPQHMTYKEYVHYLCYLFDFKIGKGWDGIEQNKYQYNWTPEESHNVETQEEALSFLGIELSDKAPDGIEKRKNQRRNGTKDTRVVKVDRRTEKKRRKEDLLNSLTYFITVWLLLIVMVSWGAYSVYLHIEGLQ
ncbi:MAG TPA: hypothetical protein DCL21_02925, partial [Alphaproteobacteria bacterium]|nr:hypothetical protein [Alphaproteobacteria bacterium]